MPDGEDPPHAVDTAGKAIPNQGTTQPDKPINLAKDSDDLKEILFWLGTPAAAAGGAAPPPGPAPAGAPARTVTAGPGKKTTRKTSGKKKKPAKKKKKVNG